MDRQPARWKGWRIVLFEQFAPVGLWRDEGACQPTFALRDGVWRHRVVSSSILLGRQGPAGVLACSQKATRWPARGMACWAGPGHLWEAGPSVLCITCIWRQAGGSAGMLRLLAEALALSRVMADEDSQPRVQPRVTPSAATNDVGLPAIHPYWGPRGPRRPRTYFR